MQTYEIPDPFMEFVKNRNLKLSGSIYDYFAKEWSYKCGTCLDVLHDTRKKIITKTRLSHTRNICLGGY
jgi:hypothetical protein